MIEKIIIIAIVCNGIRIALDEKMILHVFWKFSDFYLPLWLKKPLTHCIYCFASIYGTITYWLLPDATPTEWVLCIIGAIWMNGFISQLHD
jgi:hypothetical protein